MDSKLIKKYFRGECSSDEVVKVLDWFESNKLDPLQAEKLYQIWQEPEAEKENTVFRQDSARILAAINQRIDSLETDFVQKTISRKDSSTRKIPASPWKWMAGVAAAVLLPLCFLWLFTSYFSGEDAGRFVSVETLPGNRKTIQLEDGSKITLNGGSKIAYQPHFSTHSREITLSGEAFFEVAKDSLRPFIVKTGNLSTQALGTSFNIAYHAKEEHISVALATGSVKIGKVAKAGNRQLARLKPGQQLVFDRARQTYQVAAYDSLDILGWRKGVLYFKQANLQQVVKKMESLYGVDIELTGNVPGKKKEWYYTGTYYNESLDNVLEGMAFVKSFSYEKTDNKIRIKFN